MSRGNESLRSLRQIELDTSYAKQENAEAMDSQEAQPEKEHIHTSAEVESAMSGRIVPAHAYKPAGEGTLPQEPDEWPERHLAVSVGPTQLVVGRIRVIDAGSGHIKIEIDNPAREMEAELLPPAAARVFVDWISGIGGRLKLS